MCEIIVCSLLNLKSCKTAQVRTGLRLELVGPDTLSRSKLYDTSRSLGCFIKLLDGLSLISPEALLPFKLKISGSLHLQFTYRHFNDYRTIY